MKFLSMQFSPFSRQFLSLKYQRYLQHLVRTLNLYFSLGVKDHNFTPVQDKETYNMFSLFLHFRQGMAKRLGATLTFYIRIRKVFGSFLCSIQFIIYRCYTYSIDADSSVK
jgi:hypothetical protein